MQAAELQCVPDIIQTALDVVTTAVRAAVAQRGRASIALAGGSTPLPLYRLLAREELPWERIHVLWGDERFVAIDDPASNAGAAMTALLDRVPIPESHIHTWPILDTPEASAAAYQGEIELALGASPVLDVTLLGLGDDGHTASLFPGSGAALRTEFTLATKAPDGLSVRDRLTLGPTALGRSRLVMFLVSGAAKRPALTATFGPDAPALELRWPLDAATALELDAHPARSVTALERLLVVADPAACGEGGKSPSRPKR